MAKLIPETLPDGINSSMRRVAHALRDDLDDSATVWYTPPFDPDRVKPDLILLMPGRGIVLFAVVQQKAVDILGVVGGQVRVTDGGKETGMAPLEKAERFAVALRERLDLDPKLAETHIPVVTATILPHVSREAYLEKGLNEVLPIEACFFKPEVDAALGDQSGEFGRRIARLCGQGIPDAVDEQRLRRAVDPDLAFGRLAQVAQPTLFRAHSGEEDQVRVLDREQEAMAKKLRSGHRVVRGVAGSGKTLILVYRARHLANVSPSHRILVTCYNRALAGWLKSELQDCPGIDVTNLDKLVRSAIHDGGLAAEDPGYKDGTEGEGRAMVALKVVRRGALAKYKYDAVLIDEAQDLGTEALRFAVNLLADPVNGDLLVVADSAQKVYKKGFSWDKADIQAHGRTKVLRVNYRNTREILQVAWAFRTAGLSEEDSQEVADDENALVHPKLSGRSGPHPRLIQCATESEVAHRASAEAAQEAEQIASARGVGLLYTKRKDSGTAIHEQLEKLGTRTFWLTRPGKERVKTGQLAAKDAFADAEERLVLSTVHSSKGLDFPAVVLAISGQEEEGLDEMRSLIYVGMTRAMQRLTVVVQREHPLSGDLRNAFGES
jgi:hypothetical protein